MRFLNYLALITSIGIATIAAYFSVLGLATIFSGAFLGIVMTSAYCARFGAKLAHSMSPPRLKQGFAFFALILGIHFIMKNL